MNKKVSVRIDACSPGMVTAETIYNNYGAVIVWENTPLDSNSIFKLKDFGIDAIQVFEASLSQDAESAWNMSQKKTEQVNFAESYERDADEFKSVLHDLSVGKTVSIEKTVRIADSIYLKKDQNRDIINCITQMHNIDEYTYYHSINVSMLSMLIGKWLRFDPDDIHMLVQAGLLHDIGKSRIPFSILNKPAKLNDEELFEMRKHSEYGYCLVQYMKNIDRKISEAVLYHHEREDGSGYPMSLMGDQIPAFARVIAVADTFDAMTANRSYRMKAHPFRVFEMMQNGCFGYLNPVILDTFLTNISHYYIGSLVMLSDGRTAEVIYINRLQYGKPILKAGEEYIDMAVSKNIEVEELL